MLEQHLVAKFANMEAAIVARFDKNEAKISQAVIERNLLVDNIRAYVDDQRSVIDTVRFESTAKATKTYRDIDV